MKKTDLPGLERLLEVCRRLGLEVMTLPPRHLPLPAGTRLEGHPLDPMLAAFYARFGKAVFAPEPAGMGLFELDDEVNELESRNRQWQQDWQEQLALPLFVFGGETGLAYYYALAPGLADVEGCQPVLRVDTYEEPYALPIASNVDRFFDTYSRYLETLLAHPDYKEYGVAALPFPWDVPGLLARDERLVGLMRAGHFDSLMPQGESTREWVTRVAGSRN